MRPDVTAYHVHVCLYSHGGLPFDDIFAPGDTFVNLDRSYWAKATGTSIAAPRTLYEIARTVDRPLDVRLSPLSLLWLDLPVARTASRSGTPRKSKSQQPSRAASMSPSVRQTPAKAHGHDHDHGSNQAGVEAHTSTPASLSSTPVARFVKESSFHVDEDDRKGRNGTTRTGASEVAFGIVHLFRDDAALKDVANAKTKTTLEDDTGTVLAVLGVPAHIGPADFLQLVEPAADAISQVRMIREEVVNRCLVLLKFRESVHAEDFHRMYADKAFDPIEMPNELCRVVYVTKVSVSTTSSLPYAYPLLANSDPWPIMQSDHADGIGQSSARLTALAELPTCPVCLERMDANVTGLMTVTCQHTFHCSCLSKWSDSRCPVCRYTQSRLTKKGQSVLPSFVPENGRCAVCGTGADLWVCLICATVGCGRYKAGHAHRHYHETGHLYSLELETQRVWDYAGDGYVHRLIQSKAEFASSSDDFGPTPKTALETAAPHASSKMPGHGMEASSSSAGHTASFSELEEKMEALGLEYSNLLSTQLESQRAFYEDQVRAHQVKTEEAESSQQALATALATAHKERDELRAQFDALNSRSAHLHGHMDVSLKRVKQLDEDLRSERLMSKGLVSRIDKLTAEDRARSDDIAALRLENTELKEQVRDLMFFVEARAKVEHEGGEELRGGDVEVGKGKRLVKTTDVAATRTEDSTQGGHKPKSKKKKSKSKAPPAGGDEHVAAESAATRETFDMEPVKEDDDGKGESSS